MSFIKEASQEKSKIAGRFRNINIILLVLILILLASVVTIILTEVTGNASRNYASFYSAKTVDKFNSYINTDLALVHKVSRSKAVTDWFADEGNEEKRIAAYDEVMDYTGIAPNANLYFGIRESLNEYSVNSETEYADFVRFDAIDPALSNNSWYFDCIDSANEYTLNIGLDKASNTQYLWINHKVMENGTVLGVFCSGLALDELSEELFGQYDAQNVREYVIDKDGMIQMDSKIRLDRLLSSGGAVSNDTIKEGHIYEANSDPAFASAVKSHLENIEGSFDSRIEPEIIKLTKGFDRFMSIAPISGTDWTVITIFNSGSLFRVSQLLPLFIAVLAAFILYAVAGSALIRWLVLTPLKRLTDSISKAGSEGSHIYGNDRDDEFGELAQTIQNMRDRLSDYNSELLLTAGERDRQGKLLHAVNGAAAVLLAADEEKFENSLWEGMELMAHCMDVDRIYIWKNQMQDGILHYIQEFEWLNDAGQRGNTVHSKTGFSYAESIPEWEKMFLEGKCINGPLSGLSMTERERLGPFGIRSILVIPVYLQDHFWGFVSFDDCHLERTFTEDEVSILRSGSLMIASAMNRNETAAKMREADERTKIMLDATPLCCNLWDKNFNNIDCNEEAVKLFELKNKQEYLDRFFELSPEHQPDGQLSSEKAVKHITEAFEKGSVVFEWMHQKLDGTPVPSEITLVRVKHEEEYIVTGYTRDLREYKKMMREIEHKDTLLHTVNNVATILLQSEIDEFESILRQCMGMMADAVDVDRVYIWENHMKDGQLYSTQLYEWSEGAEPQQGNSYAVDARLSSVWEEKLSSGQCINNLVCDMSPEEQAQLSPQGIVSILVIPVFLQDQFWGFVGFDDCHRERIFSNDEESILRSGSLLIANALLRNEMTRSIRTAASKLEAALEEAKAASHAKSNFLSNMSHEMRTPMNAIIGMTLIGKSASDMERKDYAFEKIEDASNHLLGVINDVLDMSKIEANKFELSEVEFNFEKLLQKVVNVINFRIDEKQQHFTVYLDRDIPQTLIGDNQRLAQVITNLLSNAVKFTPEQGTIRLGAHFIEEEDGTCIMQIDVTDTGIGISEEQQLRLFHSFEQAESSTSRKFGGTGLGLAISKHIVELMGGSIWVESELKKGSTFAFTVRLGIGKEKSRSLLSPGVNWKNVKVLAVDDDLETREYFISIAEQFKITCDTAGGGEEAIKLIDSKGSYDIYFVDWSMPDMNGIELTRKIKARGADRSVIIMISVVEWSEIEKDAKSAGVDEFLSKPLFPSSIADCINKCIGVEESLAAKDTKSDVTESFKGYCVLLAEDVEINCEVVMAMLEPTQLTFDCAGNGKEAVKMFSAKPERYDMILMDVQMPEMDGLEATRRIRSLGFPKAEEIPIVAMTANVFREDVENCLNAGMNDHVGKPLDFDEVLAKIKYYLTL